MARWQPDARGRLREAALDLFDERGFDATTVAEIAGRAGLTERTFFRHYADKREVLFAGSEQLTELLVAAVRDAPAGGPPLEVVTDALEAADGFFGARDASRRRQRVILAHQELRERELIKLATLAEDVAAALRGRGVAAFPATLAAETGIAIFKTAFERWLEPGRAGFAELVRSTAEELRAEVSAR